MKVVSLFDGIGCARVALERAGLAVNNYYASEVDKYAISISSKRYPDTIHIGDVRGVKGKGKCFDEGFCINHPIDLLVGGSPCQDISISKMNRSQEGLNGKMSSLFWEYVRVLEETKPKWFVLENVASMPKEVKQTISNALGVEPILINASLVSAQIRKRLFWTNIPVTCLPSDRGILLKDVLEVKCIDGVAESVARRNKNRSKHQNKKGEKYGDYKKEYVWEPQRDGKSFCVKSATQEFMIRCGDVIRKPTPIECERLQGLPDNYTEGVSATQRYKLLGNAFNVDVVAHILSFI